MNKEHWDLLDPANEADKESGHVGHVQANDIALFYAFFKQESGEPVRQAIQFFKSDDCVYIDHSCPVGHFFEAFLCHIDK
ncbi:MAG: hypothetical protein NTY86_06295 [Deltaproteobacteria bacterium]|nr:hypothetical protein [Deltaproteobacteria bacterium]